MDINEAKALANKMYDSVKSTKFIRQETIDELSANFSPEEAERIVDEVARERCRERQRAYGKKYSKENAGRFRQITFKFNQANDRDVLTKLDSVKNRQGYIKSLIRADIQRNGF